MKEKLKTLEDIEICCDQINKDCPCGHVRALREEAIKWVKEDRKDFGYDTITDRWMKRFNITEEDLK